MENKYNALDITKFIMSIMVISIHAAPLVEYEGLLGYIINQGIARIAVPFFFVVSGFFLYKKISRNEFRLWAIKILKMYILWTVFYLPVSTVYLSTMSDTEWTNLLTNSLLLNLLFGYYHLWFLPAMIVGGFILWIVSSLSNFKLIALSLITYLLACFLWYGVSYGNEIINNLVVSTGYLRSGVFFGFPLMCIGYLIARNENSIKKINKKMILSLTFLFIIMLIIESAYNFYHKRILADFLFLLPFASAMIFILSLSKVKLKIKSKFNFSVISKDIYYMHVVFLMFYGKFFYGNQLILLTLSTSIAYSLMYSYSKKTIKERLA